jgi:hypothetical protein
MKTFKKTTFKWQRYQPGDMYVVRITFSQSQKSQFFVFLILIFMYSIQQCCGSGSVPVESGPFWSDPIPRDIKRTKNVAGFKSAYKFMHRSGPGRKAKRATRGRKLKLAHWHSIRAHRRSPNATNGGAWILPTRNK